MSNLTIKQENFCLAYVATGNASEASESSGITLEAKTPTNWYVYLLIDPRDDSIFYVGKGRNKRMSSHAKYAFSGTSYVNEKKNLQIMSIINSGAFVKEVVFATYDKEEDAYACERELIISLREHGLTNISKGLRTNCEQGVAGSSALFSRLRSFDDWVDSISACQRELACKVFGSVENAHSFVSSNLYEIKNFVRKVPA